MPSQSTDRSQRTASVLFLGLVLTGAFYATAPFTPGIQSFVRRYFCSHPLEIVSTAMFFAGVAILLLKTVRLRSENAAVRATLSALAGGQLGESDGTSPQPEELDIWVSQQPERHQSGFLLQRVHNTTQYVAGCGREGLEQHLRYLADLAADRLHQSFAMIRTITWAIPILGFLGTVIGITMAIANLTPEQLDSSLPQVVGGLEAAFDTTALALGMSIVLVFASFLAERREQNVLHDVERFGIDRLLPWFASGDSSATRSIGNWTDQCDVLQSAWSDTLTQHFEHLSNQLNGDVDDALSAHRQATATAQSAWSDALNSATQEAARSFASELSEFSQRVEHWQAAMLTSATASTEQTEAIHGLGRTLLKMTESEERLAALQQQLNSNLQAVQTVETLEQAVSSLTAAVNMLSIKTDHRRAA